MLLQGHPKRPPSPLEPPPSSLMFFFLASFLFLGARADYLQTTTFAGPGCTGIATTRTSTTLGCFPSGTAPTGVQYATITCASTSPSTTYTRNVFAYAGCSRASTPQPSSLVQNGTCTQFNSKEECIPGPWAPPSSPPFDVELTYANDQKCPVSNPPTGFTLRPLDTCLPPQGGGPSLPYSTKLSCVNSGTQLSTQYFPQQGCTGSANQGPIVNVTTCATSPSTTGGRTTSRTCYSGGGSSNATASPTPNPPWGPTSSPTPATPVTLPRCPPTNAISSDPAYAKYLGVFQSADRTAVLKVEASQVTFFNTTTREVTVRCLSAAVPFAGGAGLGLQSVGSRRGVSPGVPCPTTEWLELWLGLASPPGGSAGYATLGLSSWPAVPSPQSTRPAVPQAPPFPAPAATGWTMGNSPTLCTPVSATIPPALLGYGSLPLQLSQGWPEGWNALDLVAFNATGVWRFPAATAPFPLDANSPTVGASGKCLLGYKAAMPPSIPFASMSFGSTGGSTGLAGRATECLYVNASSFVSGGSGFLIHFRPTSLMATCPNGPSDREGQQTILTIMNWQPLNAMPASSSPNPSPSATPTPQPSPNTVMCPPTFEGSNLASQLLGSSTDVPFRFAPDLPQEPALTSFTLSSGWSRLSLNGGYAQSLCTSRIVNSWAASSTNYVIEFKESFLKSCETLAFTFCAMAGRAGTGDQLLTTKVCLLLVCPPNPAHTHAHNKTRAWCLPHAFPYPSPPHFQLSPTPPPLPFSLSQLYNFSAVTPGMPSQSTFGSCTDFFKAQWGGMEPPLTDTYPNFFKLPAPPATYTPDCPTQLLPDLYWGHGLLPSPMPGASATTLYISAPGFALRHPGAMRIERSCVVSASPVENFTIVVLVNDTITPPDGPTQVQACRRMQRWGNDLMYSQVSPPKSPPPPPSPRPPATGTPFLLPTAAPGAPFPGSSAPLRGGGRWCPTPPSTPSPPLPSRA